MSKVLLARPHSFIVGEMRPFLLECGYEPFAAGDLAGLAQALRSPLAGAIVSTAVSSSIDADAGTVFGLIRRQSPRLPVLFAGIMDRELMRAAVIRATREATPGATVLDPGELNAAPGRMPGPMLMFLRKDDLVNPMLRADTRRALRRYFS